MSTFDAGKKLDLQSLVDCWGQLEDESDIKSVFSMIENANHFEVYKNAQLYDLAYPGYKGDKDYYLKKGESGDVLYLGVGTGRIFADLVRKNPRALGIDISSEMIELLVSKFPSITNDQVILADALKAKFKECSFDSIIAPYSFLQCVGDEEDVLLLMQNIYRWLRPGGKFCTDIFSTYLIPFRKSGIEHGHFTLNDKTSVSIYVTYNHIEQSMREHALFIVKNEQNKVSKMDLHYFFPRELKTFFKKVGFDNISIKGGYNSEEFDPKENEIIVFDLVK